MRPIDFGTFVLVWCDYSGVKTLSEFRKSCAIYFPCSYAISSDLVQLIAHISMTVGRCLHKDLCEKDLERSHGMRLQGQSAAHQQHCLPFTPITIARTSHHVAV